MTPERSVQEGGRTLWLLDEPRADATWDPVRGVVVVHRVLRSGVTALRAQTALEVQEVPGGVLVELESDAPLERVRAIVAEVAAGDPWRDRDCWICGTSGAVLGRPCWGRTVRACEACQLLLAEEAALRPVGLPSESDEVSSLGIWRREDAVARGRQVDRVGASGPRGNARRRLLSSALPLLALPLWPPYAGRGLWLVSGVWGLLAAGVVLGPSWLAWTVLALLGLIHLAQWPLALGALSGRRGRPGRPRKALPAVFGPVDAAVGRLGVPPVDRVQLVDDATVAATEAVYEDGPARVVVLGRVALEVLSADELEVLVALALAELEESSSRLRHALDRWTDRWHHMALLAADHGGGGALGALARGLLPELVVARAALGREGFAAADVRVAQAVGAPTVARALTRHHLLHSLLSTVWWAAGRRWAQEERAEAPRLGPYLHSGLEALPPAYVDRIRANLAHEPAPWWEQAPRLGARLAALGVAVPEVDTTPGPDRVPVPADAGLERMEAWLLQSARLASLRHARAQMLLARHGGDSVAHRVARAELLRDAGDDTAAVAELEAARAEGPDDPAAQRLQLAQVAWCGDEQTMLAVARELAARSVDALTLQGAAEVLRRHGLTTQAVAALDRGVRQASSVAERSLIALDRAALTAAPDPPPAPGSTVPASR